MPHPPRTLHTATLTAQIGAYLWFVTTIATWTTWAHPIQLALAALLLVAGCAYLLAWLKDHALVEALGTHHEQPGGTRCSDS